MQNLIFVKHKVPIQLYQPILHTFEHLNRPRHNSVFEFCFWPFLFVNVLKLIWKLTYSFASFFVVFPKMQIYRFTSQKSSIILWEFSYISLSKRGQGKNL